MNQYIPAKLFFVLLALIFSCTIFGQNATSMPDFFRQVENGENTYFSQDTTMRLPMIGQVSDYYSHYEVLHESSSSIFFMEKSYMSKVGTGMQRICQCESQEQLNQHFQNIKKQFEDAAKGRFSMRSGLVWEFYESNCLDKKIYEKPKKADSPELKNLLAQRDFSTESFSTKFELINLDVETQLFRGPKGEWVINIQGELPDGYKIREIEQNSHLQYIKDEKSNYFYPPVNILNWQNRLIRSGFPNDRIFGGTPDNNAITANHFNLFAVKKNKKDNDFDVLFRLYDADESQTIGEQISAKGTLIASVISNKVESHKRSITPPLGTSQTIKCDGKKITISSTEKANQGQLVIGEDAPWSRVNIYRNEELIAEYLPRDKGALTMEGVEEEEYFLEIFLPKNKKIAIPFDIKMSSTQLTQAVVETEKTPEFVRFLINKNKDLIHQKLTAEYVLDLPLEQYLQKVTIKSIIDNLGGDLTANQAATIDKINQQAEQKRAQGIYANLVPANLKKNVSFERESFVKNRNEYELDLTIFDLPSKGASRVIVSGELTLQNKEGERRIVPWEDTLSLSKPQLLTKTTKHKKTLGIKAIPPQGIGIFSEKYHPNTNAFSAHFSLPLEDNWSYILPHPDGCKLYHLQDDKNNDLLALNSENTARRVQYMKTSRIRYGGDNDFSVNYDINSYPFSSPQSYKEPIPLSFSIGSKSSPAPDAEKIFGKAKVAYFAFERDKKMTQETSFTFSNDRIIEFEIEGELIQFENSKFSDWDRAKDGFLMYKKATKENSKLFIQSVHIKNTAGELINILPVEQLQNQVILREFSLDKSKLTDKLLFEIHYFHLEAFEKEVDVEIGLGL